MKVTIITATYNSAATIRTTIESIAKQTYKDIEHIIVDGVSSDNTVEIAKEYDSVSRIISEPDKGLYDAINKGIKAASGDIIGILNSDDFFACDTTIQTVVDNLSQTGTEAVYGDVCYVSHDASYKPVRHYSSNFFRPWMMRLGFMPAHPSFYAKKEMFQKVGLYNDTYKIAADFEFLLRCFMIHKINYHYVRETMVFMRVGGISNRDINSHKVIFSEHRRALRTNNIYSNSLLLCMRYPIKIVQILWYNLWLKRLMPKEIEPNI